MTSERPLPPDNADRQQATDDLDRNYLVEAGAGSGKTTLLVGRLLGYVLRGTPVDQLAAITFTRKAAGELRERFQERLEEVTLSPAYTDTARALATRALSELDRAFLGTIHAFCGRLLRERPIEAGLEPGFRELEPYEADERRDAFWAAWVERGFVAQDARLLALKAVGLEPYQLAPSFATWVAHPDVDFSAADTPLPPRWTACRKELEVLIADALRLMGPTEPEGGWDTLQGAFLQLAHLQRISDWSDPVIFCSHLELARPLGKAKPVQKKWTGEGSDAAAKKQAKDFGESRCIPFMSEGGIGFTVLQQWLVHRYAPAERALRSAEREYRAEREQRGELTFEDLLLLAAELLDRQPEARQALGARYQHLLVDEFQDTDPVQAKVVFLLAARADWPGGKWEEAPLRDGALFVVGDPKQSIYRFRRADIAMYQQVRRRMAQTPNAGVLRLTANFRSVPGIAALVNQHFGHGVFGTEENETQAQYSEMQAARPSVEPPVPALLHYVVPKNGLKADKLVADAGMLAAWIADAIAAEARKPADFLVLARNKAGLSAVATALAERGVPVTVSGATGALDDEIIALRQVVEALADPDHPIACAAVLEGLLFGCTPADLYDAQVAGLTFSLLSPAVTLRAPSDGALRVHAALTTLGEWLQRSRMEPPDAVLESVLTDTGLLAWVAASPLGDTRAGILRRLVQQVRDQTQVQGASLRDVLHVLDRALADDIPDAQLRPGRGDAVRVMNLHKAKGLEATVVVLAAPFDKKDHPPRVHVQRVGDEARGGALIAVPNGFHWRTLAQPPAWSEMEARERVFAAAEEERLLYVALTRAKEQLVVARLEAPAKAGGVPSWQWGSVQATMDALQSLPLPSAAGSRSAGLGGSLDVAALQRDIADATARRTAAGVASYRVESVSQASKRDGQGLLAEHREVRPPRDAITNTHGPQWGRVMHQLIEAMGRGARGAMLALRAQQLVAEEYAAEAHDADATAATVRRALHIVERLRTTDEWQALERADERAFEWPVVLWSAADERLLEGVMDAAYRDAQGWVVLDWKTDRVMDDARRTMYEAQVALYADALATLTAQPARGALVWLTPLEDDA